MDLECAKTLLKNVFDEYSGEKNDLVRAMNELLVKSQQPTHTSEQVVPNCDSFQDAEELGEEVGETPSSVLTEEIKKQLNHIITRRR